MKFLLATGIALCGAVSASQHAHQHNHAARGHSHDLEKKGLAKKDLVVELVEETVVECWYNGYLLSASECEEGVYNGTLKFVDEASAPHPTTLTTHYVSTTSKSSALPPSTYAPSPSPSPSPEPVYAPSYGTGGWGSVDAEFPDGQLDCSQFPDEYGAVPLNWLNIGGWASIQKPTQELDGGYDTIVSLTKQECPDGNCCVEGAFCSYACPNGFLKYQWPSKQGATGQSIGGLQCKNGKLYLTNPGVKTLCAKGSTNVKVTVKNNLSQNVAICRTNYPGDEKMSIPVDVNPGETKELACPDSASYYVWDNKGTSAQYYINMPGYAVEKACVWGDYGDDFGNWAPGNLGVGWSNGRAWLSITANHPTQMVATLPYAIELIGGNTKCRYQNGQYCGGDNYQTCSSEGCTVSAGPGGELTYVLG